MEFRIISLPPFTAAFSGIDTRFDFSPNGILGKFGKFFSKITPSARDSFMPRDFLFYDPEKKGMGWMWAINEDMDAGGYPTIEFDGGYYLTYVYTDGDEAEGEKLHDAAIKLIEGSAAFELDSRENHYPMGHIITPEAIKNVTGVSQMETFIPIKLKV